MKGKHISKKTQKKLQLKTEGNEGSIQTLVKRADQGCRLAKQELLRLLPNSKGF